MHKGFGSSLNTADSLPNILGFFRSLAIYSPKTKIVATPINVNLKAFNLRGKSVILLKIGFCESNKPNLTRS